MKEKMTKRQHYVPKFYLRNFSTVDSMLWGYDKLSRKYFESNPNGICYKNDLYETPWESHDEKLGKYVLQNQIECNFVNNEGTYSTLLKKIINICGNPQNRNALICNKDEKRTLASFVINMLLRNPWSLVQAEVNSVEDELMKNEEIQSINQLLQQINFGDIKSLIKSANKKVWLVDEFAGGVPVQLTNELLDLSYNVFVSKDHQFVTSDFPVLYEIYEPVKGDSHFKTIYLPISPYCLLQYSNNSTAKPYRNRMTSISAEGVDHINQFYWESGTNQSRLIIASEESILKHIVNSN
jgi:hypothetical protein